MSLEMINIEPEPDRPNLEQVQSDVGGTFYQANVGGSRALAC